MILRTFLVETGIVLLAAEPEADALIFEIFEDGLMIPP